MKVFFALLSVLAVASAMTESSLLAKNSHYRVSDPSLFPKIPLTDGRIVGGQDAREGQFPYIVSLRWSASANSATASHFCGGFALTPRIAGTAAHCIYDITEDERPFFSVRAGMLLVNEGKIFEVESWHWSEYYDVEFYADMDVGVVKIVGEFFSDSFSQIQPIALDSVDPAPGEQVTISGWGRLQSGGQSPTTLQYTTVNIVDRAECLAAYTANVTINNICASYPDRDSCQGDSGGPLTSDRGISGIVSWGYGCAHPDYPGVYAAIAAPRILEYLNRFIEGIHPW